MTSPGADAVSADDVDAAATRLAPHVRRTPVLRSPALDELVGSEVFLKCEHLQHTGSFKVRGATHAVLQLGDAAAARGVVAHSSGNHAAALARAAATRGIPCWIAMPHDAPPSKRDNTRRYGAHVVDCGGTMTDREAEVERIIAATGATEIHPFDNRDVIAGAGTAALELVDEIGTLDVIIVPIGGGGLASGTSLIARRAGIDTIAAEPSLADDAARSLATGVRQPQCPPVTVADGLRTNLSDLTFSIVQRTLDRIIVVDEEAIEPAARLVAPDVGTIEPSSAVAIAALLSPEFGGGGSSTARRVGVILSGGNVMPPG